MASKRIDVCHELTRSLLLSSTPTAVEMGSTSSVTPWHWVGLPEKLVQAGDLALGMSADASMPLSPHETSGHESAGEIVAVGEGVSDVKVGDRVAIEAGVYCKACRFCKIGRYNLCKNSK